MREDRKIPSNPKTPEEFEAYLLFCREQGVEIPQFRGVEPFVYLHQKGSIFPGYTIIRLRNYATVIDRAYYATEDGKLVDIQDETKTSLEPEEILSEEANPDGWDVERLR